MEGISNISLNQLSKVQELVNVKLLKDSMDFQEETAEQLINMMKDALVGQNVDVMV